MYKKLTKEKTKKDLQIRIEQLEKKNEELSLWLYNNTKHPDFGKIATDRNNNNFKIGSLQEILNNWGLPPPLHFAKHTIPPPNAQKKYS